MKEDNLKVISEIGPDLLVPPHVLPILMELFAGDRQQALLQQKQLLTHIAACHYCRIAVAVLLDIAQEYDCRNSDPEGSAGKLLVRFVAICRAIEAREYERLGAYAEAIVAEGQERADLLFPDVAIHLRTNPDGCSMLKATVAFLTEEEETG